MTTRPELDDLLSAPLKHVDDEDFSKRVSARIAAREWAWIVAEGSAAIVVFAVIVAFAPAAAIAVPIEKLALDLGTSLPFAAGCAALALTLVSLRWFADEV